MVEEHKGKHLRKDVIVETDYSIYVPMKREPRFQTIYPIYPGRLKMHKSKRMKHGRNLERNLEFSVLAVSLLASTMFLSTNLTGLAISNLNQSDVNIVGAIFFVAGVLIGLMGLRGRSIPRPTRNPSRF